MKNINIIAIIALISLLFTSCEKEAVSIQELETNNQVSLTTEDELVLEFSTIVKNNKEQIIKTLKDSKLPVSLEVLMRQTAIAKSSTTFIHKTKAAKSEAALEAFEFWMYTPEIATFDELLVAMASENEKSNQPVIAYNLAGEKILLEAEIAPEQPVIVIEKNGFHALQQRVEAMNSELEQSGLRSANAMSTTKGFSKASLNTTKLDAIELKDVQETWIQGGAEIYAITSGIRNGQNEPEINVIPMYYLDHSDEVYLPNQILLFWDDYRYQAANIQLFEQDDNHNYQELVSMLIREILNITGTLAGLPWVTALSEVAGAIVDALPSNFFTNDDDYIDSFYTIEKNKSYTNYQGVARNAKVTLTPFTLLEN